MVAQHVLHDRRRKPERGLVEHHELRRAHQAAADRQHLLLAARQRAGRLRRALRQHAETAPARARDCAARPAARARQHRAHVEVLGDRQRRETPGGLRPPGRCRDRRRDGSASRRCRCRETRCGRAPAGACRRWCGSARSCRRRWRRRWRRSRPPRPRATRRRAPARRRRTHRGSRRASISRPPPRRDRTAPPPDRARPPRACPSAIAAPWCSTSTRAASAITARMTCSISRMVSPVSRLSSRQDRDHAVGLGRPQARHHLVEQQELRLGRERARDFEPLAVGQRQRRRELVPLVEQVEPPQHLVRAPARRRRRRAGAAARRR